MEDSTTSYEIEAVYKTVEQIALDRSLPQSRPKAFLLGGQPGAGKSTLAAEAIRELRNRGRAVIIDADRMREVNPRYLHLARLDPQGAADLTHGLAAQWATRLTITAMHNRRNLVIDGTMRDPANIRDLTHRLKASCYEIEADVIAVKGETSLLRARLRFELSMTERGLGRFVNREQHDNAYAGLAATVAILEQEKLVDAIKITNAMQHPIYHNVLRNGQWEHAAQARAALDVERARPWTYAEHQDYIELLETVAALTRQRIQIGDKHINDLAELEEQIQHERDSLENAYGMSMQREPHEVAACAGGVYVGPIVGMDDSVVRQIDTSTGQTILHARNLLCGDGLSVSGADMRIEYHASSSVGIVSTGDLSVGSEGHQVEPPDLEL